MPTATAPSTNPATRDPALDGLRGVAILLVYLFHYGGGLRSPHPAVRLLGFLTEAGWTGVELFFALSGFLITALLRDHLRSAQSLRSFLARRAWRILPVYWGALLAAALTAWFTSTPFSLLPPLLIYLAFGQNLPTLVDVALCFPSPLPLHHLWTIAVEAQFYLLWPPLLAAAGTQKRALRLCLWLFALSCIFRAVIFWPHLLSPGATSAWSPFLLTRLGGLALGSALALVEPIWLARFVRTWAAPLLVLATAALGLVSWHCGDLLLAHPLQFSLSLPAVEIACALGVAGSLQPGSWRTMLSCRPLGWLGRISYGFYVLHILLEPFFDRVGELCAHAHSGTTYLLVRFVVAFPVSAAAAWLCFHFAEQPLLRHHRRSGPPLAHGGRLLGSAPS